MFSQPKALNTSLHWSGRRSSKGFLLSFFLGFFLQYVSIVSFSISLCRSTITMMCEGKMRFHLSRRKKPDGLRISRGRGGRKGWRPLTDPRGASGTPPWGSKFFHFHAVFSKNLKNNSNFGSWRTPWGKSWIRHRRHQQYFGQISENVRKPFELWIR